MLKTLIILLIIIPNYGSYPLVSIYSIELKDNGGNTIAIASQGDHTFIIRSNFRIKKWNQTTTSFESFQGPQLNGVDIDIISIGANYKGNVGVCTVTGDVYFGSYLGSWTKIEINGRKCKSIKLGFGEDPMVLMTDENNYSIYFLNQKKSWSFLPNVNSISGAIDGEGIF